MTLCWRFLESGDAEIYVTLQDGVFRLPSTLPDKFASRSLQKENGFLIDSVPYTHSILTNKASLSSGIWICKDDLTSRGGFANVFGFPLEVPESAFDGLVSSMRVAYHGTSYEHWKDISQQNALNVGLGQLGTGVYLGTFWKACRFAFRNQAYELRQHPVVVRTLWSAVPLIEFPVDEPCSCIRCTGKTLEKACACGHTLNWMDRSDAGHLVPRQYSDGTWITQNEEWVTSPRHIQRIDCAVRMDPSSTAMPHYNPLQRDYKVL